MLEIALLETLLGQGSGTLEVALVEPGHVNIRQLLYKRREGCRSPLSRAGTVPGIVPAKVLQSRICRVVKRLVGGA